jgi:hypothetical protein
MYISAVLMESRTLLSEIILMALVVHYVRVASSLQETFDSLSCLVGMSIRQVASMILYCIRYLAP